MTHWADVLELRPEVVQRRGHADGLQMSLYKAVYQTTDVPYRDAGYWCDITEPTTKLVEFMAEIARHLGGAGGAGQLLAGTGSSTSTRAWAAARATPWSGSGTWPRIREEFFATDIGAAGPRRLPSEPARAVELSADARSSSALTTSRPGVARPEFGPAVNLHQRFLWSLFERRPASTTAMSVRAPTRQPSRTPWPLPAAGADPAR